MTKIKDIFAKPINRNIRGVIKIGQDSEQIKEQELDEYVVTDELKRNFTNFFDAYNKSINNLTDEMGVWISGFFGSGKSHFLKILSYLLENDVVKGRRAIDYFLEDGKFDDNHLAEAINKATSVPTDVALFNIDSKADSNAGNDDSAILTVFLKVFNEQLGYSPIPIVAQMERWLDSEGKYEAFKDEFQKLGPNSWVEARHSYIIMHERIKNALINSNALSEIDAENYLKNMETQHFSISPEEFADLVKDYLDKQGQDHHFIFLADEVGQFIGDNDRRMLNLQTIVEQLGVKCQGRAWVVVTSQQQMSEVTEGFSHHERDFSKIQGRFNTLINMSSANADEIIRKRLLEKKEPAKSQLYDLFEQKKYSINNKISFSDSIKRQTFNDADQFSQNYPFVPYQFSLLKDVLAAVRRKGASGSHMSDAERSMLATFQKAIIKYEDREVGTLVPFSQFFLGMREFLNHDHQIVFDKAISDDYINPNHEDYPFNIQVLAVLFMIKYVDNYPATLDNIVTLLIDGVDQDRIALTAKVRDALSVLIRQNYVQQKLDTYEFLTDSEQEVNESINAIEVDDRDVIQQIGKYLLSSNSIDAKYKYPHMNNQYIFEFNMYIDGNGLNRPDNELNIRIVSPLESGKYTDLDFKQDSSNGKNIIVVLKNDDRYIENYRRIEKINKYIQSPESRSDDIKQQIAFARKAEATDIMNTTQKLLTDGLIDADIYVLGDVLPKGTSFDSRFNNAKNELISNSYRNLSYLTSVKNEDDITNVLKGKNEITLVNENEQAISEVTNYISTQTGMMNNISFANVRQRFHQIPYGYAPVDTAWMVAKAFMDGKLKLYYNNEQITINDAKQDPKSVERYLMSKNSSAKLTIKPVRELSKRQKDDAKTFVEEVLDSRLTIMPNDTSEMIASEVKEKVNAEVNKLKGLASERFSIDVSYPNHELLEEGIEKLSRIVNHDSDSIFQYISDNLDSLEDWRDDIDDRAVLEFYGDIQSKSEQQTIWDRSRQHLNRYNAASALIDNDELRNVAAQLADNLNNENFTQSIPKLRKLNTEFSEKYSDEIQKLFDRIAEKIDKTSETLNARLLESKFPAENQQQLESEIKDKFKQLKDNADQFSNSNDINSYVKLFGITQEIESVRQRLQDRINETSLMLVKKAKEEEQTAKANTTTATVEPHPDNNNNSVKPSEPISVIQPKVTRSLTIKDLVDEDSWHITNEADLDKYIDLLRDKLTKELKDYDILNIDFR